MQQRQPDEPRDLHHARVAEFVELDRRVTPQLGRALLFQHRILHRASEVEAGEKFVLRTDVLYRPR